MLLAATSYETGHLLASGHAAAGLLFGLIVALTIGILTRTISRRATISFPFRRSASVNLIATPPGSTTPRIWLAAHLDSKSQTIPMLVRIASVATFVTFFIALLIVAAVVALSGETGTLSPIQPSMASIAKVISVIASLSLIPVMLCFIGNGSSGALDNASGVAAVLAAAERLGGTDVGIVITSGEELGLAGARAFAARRPAAIAINCDTIDDDGDFICMRSGSSTEALSSALTRATSESGVAIRKTRSGGYLRSMLPGVLADNIAFTDAGWDSFTLSRGNLRTLALVHTSSDRAETIDGTGIAQAALLIVAIAKELS